jgi:hypothetical protein
MLFYDCKIQPVMTGTKPQKAWDLGKNQFPGLKGPVALAVNLF